LLRLVPETKWVDFPHQLSEVGRGPCTARSPDHEACPLLRWCPTGQEALVTPPVPSLSSGASAR
jgi:endonuclease III